MEKGQPCQQMVPEQMDIQARAHRIQTQTPHPSQKLTQNGSQNVKCKTIKLLEDKIGENLDDLGFGNDFLDTTPKA